MTARMVSFNTYLWQYSIINRIYVPHLASRDSALDKLIYLVSGTKHDILAKILQLCYNAAFGPESN